MRTETIPYSDGDDSFDAFVARPDGTGDRPAIVVCHAWGGRDELVESKTKELAELGYIGAAIDLYGVGKRGTDKASSGALMSALVDEPALLRRRLTRSFETIRALPGVDGERMGALGFCFGGLCALLCARMGLPMRGVVSFHGLLKLGAPLEAKVTAQLLVLHGQDDPMVPPSDVAAFAAEMKRVDADWRLHAYPGVMHSFTNPKANDPDFGTVYDERTDRRSWAEMKAFFEEVLG